MEAKSKDPRQLCCWEGRYFFDAIKAIITRLLFGLHAILAIYGVTQVRSQKYWLLSITYTGMLVEAMFVLLKRRGQEWKWFQFSVLLFLLTAVPPIWLIEITRLERWANSLNITTFTKPAPHVDSAEAAALEISGELDEVAWTIILEQALVVTIIIGRWLMPKGELTRDQLSALLLMYLGTASDIIDFMSILFEPNIVTTGPYLYAVLAVWTLSLLQFPFVTTITKGETEADEESTDLTTATDYSKDIDSPKPSNLESKIAFFASFFETEIWGICVSVLMQDGPFFIMRMIALLAFHIGTYTNYFFTAKNGIVLVLQVYRLISIYTDYKKQKQEKANKSRFKTTAELYANAFQVTGFGKGKSGTSQLIDG